LVIIYLVSVIKPNFWVVSALFFLFWGDVLLLFQDQYFVFGLGFFFLTHLFYIKASSGLLKKISVMKILLICLPFLVYSTFLLALIYPNLNDLKLPVFAYATIIAIFGVVSLMNYIQEKSVENTWFLIGAILFIISDSLIAINKFYGAKEIYGILIMITYILAQYLICKAFIVKNKLH
tara:strand:- start:1035 stop:1568 length:534 start_codon:yes stop_codon:yes gene_type:complete